MVVIIILALIINNVNLYHSRFVKGNVACKCLFQNEAVGQFTQRLCYNCRIIFQLKALAFNQNINTNYYLVVIKTVKHFSIKGTQLSNTDCSARFLPSAMDDSSGVTLQVLSIVD